MMPFKTSILLFTRWIVVVNDWKIEAVIKKQAKTVFIFSTSKYTYALPNVNYHLNFGEQCLIKLFLEIGRELLSNN